MVLGNILAELVCNGFLYLFASPFMPEKKDKVELDNYNFDFSNPEDDSKLSEKETDIQWWDGEISKTETVEKLKRRCKYYSDVEGNGKKRKKRCKNYHENENIVLNILIKKDSQLRNQYNLKPLDIYH